MSYRGEDLDLRTPQTWGAASGDAAASGEPASAPNSSRPSYRNGPILVDETVLACSNHAFEIALAHRAGEVRIEHLLHALTRFDPAAEALEARGVRVAALRRESATIIANEIPAGLPNGKGSPRRSEEFADVLRMASASAARRNAPAGIDDLLNVLLDQRLDIPALALLTRHMPRPISRDAVDPLPPLTRYVPEARYASQPYERYGKPVPEAPRYVVSEPARGYRPEYAGTQTDMLQNSRIEALEQMVRALGNDLASERQIVAGMLKDLSRDTLAQRDDQGRLHTGLYDRMQTLEQAVTQTRANGSTDSLVEQLQNIETGLELRLQEMSQSWSVLSMRLQNLEAAVRDSGAAGGDPSLAIERIKQAIDLKPIASRLDIIEEAVLGRDGSGGGDVVDRLKSLEGEIARALSANTASTGRMETLIAGFQKDKSGLGAPLVERFVSLADTLDAQRNEANQASLQLVERLTAVERAVAAEIETSGAKHQAYAKDLQEVHDALMKLNQNQHTLAGSIDQWRTDASGDIATITSRLTGLDQDNERPLAELTALTSNIDAMNKLMVERYHRRNRFWYWLFGTDDWISKSWPSQSEAIDAEKQRLKAPQSAA